MSVSVGERPASNGYAVARNLDPELVPVSTLKPLGRETRKQPVLRRCASWRKALTGSALSCRS